MQRTSWIALVEYNETESHNCLLSLGQASQFATFKIYKRLLAHAKLCGKANYSFAFWHHDLIVFIVDTGFASQPLILLMIAPIRRPGLARGTKSDIINLITPIVLDDQRARWVIISKLIGELEHSGLRLRVSCAKLHQVVRA